MHGTTAPVQVRAVVSERFGSPTTMTVEEIEVPGPGPFEVRISVRSVSLNPADWHGVVGYPLVARPALGWAKPKRRVQGTDVAGVVDAVGSAVTDVDVGDAVFGFSDGGGFAEQVVVSAEHVLAKPETVSFDAAAAIGVAGFTALQAVRDVARVAPGCHVLVNGATGGVGHLATQMAKTFGAEVTAVCSTANIETARTLGADHVIDYTTTDFTKGTTRYDVILDNPGNHPLRACRRVLQPDGVYVLIGGSKSPMFGPIPRVLRTKLLGMFSSQRFEMMLAKDTAEDLAVLQTMLADGSIDPLVSETVTLDEIPAALERLGHGHTLGKIVAHP